MSSLANLAKRIVRATRIKSSKQPTTFQTPVAPLSTELSARIPQELFERIIDHLYNDARGLLACSLVCRAWVPASRYHLFRRLVVRPLVLTSARFRVHCSVALRGTKQILYGADDGIYMSGLSLETPPALVLFIPEPVTQIDVLENHNLVVFLSAHKLVMTVPLKILSPSNPKDSSACTRVASNATFFKQGVILGRQVICVIKAGLVTTGKLLEPVFTPALRGFSLRLYKEFYVSEKVTSIHFLRTKLVAGTSHHDFEMIDVETLVTQPLLDPSVTLPNTKSSPKCLAVFRTDQDVLICYNCFAVYIDIHGQLVGRETIRWRNNSIQAVALREPYLVAFGAEYIEVRYAHNGALVQTIWIGHTILSTSPELFMIQAGDGRLLGLQFAD